MQKNPNIQSKPKEREWQRSRLKWDGINQAERSKEYMNWSINKGIL
jgi:hypothetical protein